MASTDPSRKAPRGGVALLTISYAGDLDMCRKLCASVDRLAPGRRHYLAVDRADRPLFESLAGPDRVLLETERFMPRTLQTTAFGRRLWLTPYGPPIRGWIYQQLVKLAITASLEEEAVVVIDSDAVFLRPLADARVLRDGRTRLYRAPGAADGPEHVKWHRVARRLLGLPRGGYTGADYITTGVTWRPDIVRDLLARIERVGRLPWRMALSWRFRFAEYILYGVFAEHVPGPQRDRVFFDDRDLCHCSWHYDLSRPEGRRAFVEGLDDDHVAALVQSNLRLPEAERDALLREVEARADAASHSGTV